MRHWSRVPTLATLALLGGCYAYTDIDPAAVAPGSRVRVTLEREEAVRQIDVLGGLRERVEGEVQPQSTAGTLALTVRQAATPAQGGIFRSFVTLPWTSVTGVEAKHFSPGRTALAALGTGALAVGVLQVLEAVTDGGGSEGPNTSEAVRIPLVRLRW